MNCYEANRLLLSRFIAEVHREHSTWGYHQLAEKIRERTGWKFSDNLCHKCCKELSIKSKARPAPYVRPKEESVLFPNIVANDWETTRPLEKVCTDTTMFYNRGRPYDLTLYLDAFNNEIAAYDLAVSKHGVGIENHFGALKKLLKAIKKRGYSGLETIVHSDQGIIYTSRAFANAHKNYNIVRSMSRRATPTDNPIIEAINGWMKEEMEKDFDIGKTDDIHKAIKAYIYYFNNERMAYSLKYKSPVQYRTELGFK
jgi:putative transposase